MATHSATPSPSVLVIGAGMAGLTAARELLARGFRVLVVDKSRGVGGRMATRRFSDAVFDHGTQAFHAHTPEFIDAVRAWMESGVVERFSCEPETGSGLRTRSDQSCFTGIGGMTALAKHLAADVPIEKGARVIRLSEHGDCWWAFAEDGRFFQADIVLLTAPVPQALELIIGSGLDIDKSMRAALLTAHYTSCFAVMAVLDRDPQLPPEGWIVFDGGTIARIVDMRAKRLCAVPSVTVHAGDEYSTANINTDLHLVKDTLLHEAADWLSAGVLEAQVHRWLYAQPSATVDAPYLRISAHPPLYMAGDGFGRGGNVEGAWHSGRAAADAIGRGSGTA